MKINYSPFTDDELRVMRLAMNWVIPPDSTPGAGTDTCQRHLIELVLSLDLASKYQEGLVNLTEDSLQDPKNPFAKLFIDQVRDCYYGFEDTGAWEDIGFTVTG